MAKNQDFLVLTPKELQHLTMRTISAMALLDEHGPKFAAKAACHLHEVLNRLSEYNRILCNPAYDYEYELIPIDN